MNRGRLIQSILLKVCLLFVLAGAAVVAIDMLILAEDDSAADNSTAAGIDGPTTLASAEVERVIDGDTIELIIDGKHERVRLIGIDTPESVSRSVPQQCFGAEAADAVRSLLPAGTRVEIQRDVEARDRYDRLLLYVYRADDRLFVNRWLIEHGFADAVSYRPNTSHQADFAEVLRAAKASSVGLWAVCDGPDQPLS